MTDQPTFVRVEYWSVKSGEWTVGHAGVNLMDPAVYVQKLAKDGLIARAVEVDSGVTFYGSEGADLL